MKFWGLMIAILLSTSAANAAIVLPNLTYILGDHPDAQLAQGSATISYGLRLDAQGSNGFGGDGSDAAKTFSTTQDGAAVSLLWDTTGISDEVRITGQLSRNSNNSLWNVDYTLTDIVVDALGFKAKVGSGTLTNANNAAEVFNLTGVKDGEYVFLGLGDGHRLSGDTTTEVGRGWLQPTSSTDDWLVTLTPVPVPAALPLIISGLLGFSIFSRHRKTA